MSAVSDAKISEAPVIPNNTPQPTPPTPNDGFQTVHHHKRQPKIAQPVIPQPEAMPIPVIQLGIANISKPLPRPPTYAHAAATSTRTNSVTRPAAPPAARPGQGTRKRQKPKTIIYGTSLTAGISAELHSRGIDSTTHIKRGAHIPFLRKRVPYVFPSQPECQPDNIALLCGGNDSEDSSFDKTVIEYEGLIRDVRRACPRSKIILCSVPPRKDNRTINDRITKLNKYLCRRGDQNDNVIYADVAPTDPKMFTKKKVHFNDKGKSEVARLLKPFIMD